MKMQLSLVTQLRVMVEESMHGHTATLTFVGTPHSLITQLVPAVVAVVESVHGLIAM